MLLEFNREEAYNLIEEEAIKTECGMLCKATDEEFGRYVAVKQVKIEGSSPKDRKTNLNKAMTEVKAMVNIGEENVAIPSIYSTWYDEKNSDFYIIMEWVKGKTLAENMNAPEGDFLRWMVELIDILSVMEKKNIYHKDIKPTNIMITPRKKMYLIDFNISISNPNLIEGTQGFKAPEMDKDSKYVGREKVDMFSIGVIMYMYYTGKMPMRGAEYARNRSRGAFAWDMFTEPKELNSGMNQKINDFIVKAMKLDTKDRFRNYADMKAALLSAKRG